jgi:hypothetical protein
MLTPPIAEAVAKLLTPAAVSRQLGPGRDDRPVAPSTIVRWGLRGVPLRDGSRLRLPMRRLPGGWRIAQADLDEFIANLTADRLGQPAPATPPRAPSARDRENERVGRELDALGIR